MTTSSTPEPSNPVPPEDYTTRLRMTPTVTWPMLVLVVAIGALVVLFLTGRLALRPDPNSPEGKTYALKDIAQQNVDFAHEADSALNKVTWEAAQLKLRTSQDLHRQLNERLPKLTAELRSLEEGDAGKRIATRPAWVDQFLTVRDRKRLTEEELTGQLRAIQTLLPICERALKEKRIVVECDDRFRAQVEEIHRPLAKAVQEVEADQRGLQALLATSRSESPSATNLAAAAAAREQIRQSESLAQLAAERESQKEELEQKARQQQLTTERESQEAKIAAEQKVRDADLARQKTEEALRVAQAQAKSEEASRTLKQTQDAQVADRERQQRLTRFEAALPGLKSMLSPFISNGKYQLVAGKSWQETEPGPLSLAAIKATGLLREENWLRLSELTRGPSCLNDRPLGSFPANIFQTDEREMRRLHQFLRDYGDLLVERGLLRP